MRDKKKLAVIHIVKKELGLSEEEYRNILKKVAGVETAKDLDEESFKKLMHYFVRSRYYQLNPLGLTLKQKLFIEYLAKELNWDKMHLSNFLHKYYHKSRIEDLSRKEAIKVIESLKIIKQHQKGKEDEICRKN
ncbi:MAG: regulatory protein GemA [Candidatus Omnitrophica bacterium]|nr:regulatory protein GemA [Candidatus Omnitrophota bacterium]